MNKITAKEARKLAGMTAEEAVEEVYQAIREAAKQGKRQLNLHDDFLDIWWI